MRMPTPSSPTMPSSFIDTRAIEVPYSTYSVVEKYAAGGQQYRRSHG